MNKEIIYLDNNGTTIMPTTVINTINKWFNRGNPSSSYSSAIECKKLFKSFRSYIAETCKFNMDTMDGYTIVFTSGASESNSHIISSSVRAFARKTGKLPHVITSSIEHKSILLECEQLEKDGLCQVTYLPVISDNKSQFYGCVDLDVLKRSIKSNTCLVSIMAINNETGVFNNIMEIGNICKGSNIPFHTDFVQLFGKTDLDLSNINIDALSVTFHKIHGPPGVGLLIIRNKFIKGYELPALIAGTQNYGLRGGTENVACVAGSFMAYKMSMENIAQRNASIRKKKQLIKSVIAKRIPCCYIQDYDMNHTNQCMIVWISPKLESITSPGTIYMSIDKPNMCNVKLKQKLESHGIIVSIGSACNTSSKKASHVVDALHIPDRLRMGIFRVSLCDDISEEQCMYFCKVILHYCLKD